jgi:hypothetical protein
MSYLTTEPIDLDVDYESSSSEEENNELEHEENARILSHRLSYIGHKSLDMLSLQSRPNIKNTKLLHKKSLRVLQTALQQTQFDPKGFIDDTDNIEAPEDVSSARSDRTDNSANRFKLNEDLPASEQQKICTNRVITVSEKLATDIQVLLKDNLIESADKEKQIANLLAEFKKDLRLVARNSSRIKVELGNPRDWNAEYRRVMEIEPKTVPEQLKKFKSIASLTQDFESTAQMYGKIIISEVFVKNKFRTIKPFAVGGNAGGEKFIYNGILFKFAVDWKGIYGGDHAAMKAANQEMLCLMSVQDADVEGLCTPLMCLIDYLGFRLVAIALLPVSNSTLMYGSDDGGKTVKASNDDLNKKMVELAKRLNLAEHTAGMQRFSAKRISFPVDIEAHLGEDGRYYLLDTARLMPPTFPDKKIRGCFLFRMFRPEFVRSYSKQLSSDACSPCFDIHEPKREEHAANIQAATDNLMNGAIPKASTLLDRHSEKLTMEEVLEYLHASGINLRYLAQVYKQSLSAYFKLILLLEMVARGIKNSLWQMLREAKRSLQSMAEQSYKELIAHTCNKVLGTFEYKDSTNEFWSSLHKNLKDSFLGFPHAEELTRDATDPKTKYAFAILEGVCPTVKYGEIRVPMTTFKCFSCGLTGAKEICSVCIKECHASHGHKVSNNANTASGYMCSCSQQTTCQSVKKYSSIVPDDDLRDVIRNPLKYLIKKIGFDRLFRRVQELSGIVFSQASIDEVAKDPDNYCFVLPDIESITAKIKRLPVVSIAEARNLVLRARQHSNQPERMSLLKQSIGMMEEALRIYPGSETLLNFYVEICLETAFIVESDLADTLFFKAIKVYRVLKNKEKVLELIRNIKEKKKVVHPSIIQSCFDIVFNPSISSITLRDLNFLVLYGADVQVLTLDGLALIDDKMLEQIGVGCGQLSSLSITYCDKVTDAGMEALFERCGEGLRELFIDGNNRLTDTTLKLLAKKCPSLVNLSIVACEGFTDEGFKSLSNLKFLAIINMCYNSYAPNLASTSLQSLFLVKNNINIKTARYLLKNCPNLQTLDLSICQQLGNAAELLPYIIPQLKLRFLALEKVPLNVTDKLMKDLKQISLALIGRKVTILSDCISKDDADKLRDLGFYIQITENSSQQTPIA